MPLTNNISKILIANRGEIACRVISTAKKMGITTVAVYSEADSAAQHVQQADEAYCIGPAPASQSYLDADKIIELARTKQCDAIHPGYGFLSENAPFSKKCEENNITFIGPPTSAIEAMGSKSEAKQIMQDAGVPLVEGYHGENQDPEFLHSQADKIGYPLLIKATAGGGGKGMRVVQSTEEFMSSLESCKRESLASFGDDKVLVEKYLTKPRHVEIQVFADNHGNAVHLFERDCSVQRRHQKIIEEAPAPGLSEETRQAMGQVAITAAKAINYSGAGTVEFLYDEDGSFYFMEMNTRLQVEHPVTEKITGLDLVEWQIVVANNQKLPLEQQQLQINGHAFEARIYAEDPANDFLPVTGRINYLRLPKLDNNTRVDSGIAEGDTVSVFYDPMIAKLIVWDEDREKALSRMSEALTHFHLAGFTTNIEFLHQLTEHKAFKAADLDTHFLEKYSADFNQEQQKTNSEKFLPIIFSAAVCFYFKTNLVTPTKEPLARQSNPWHTNDLWRLNQRVSHEIKLNYSDDKQEQADISLKISPTTIVNNSRAKLKISLDEKHFDVIASVENNENTTYIAMEVDGRKYKMTASLAELENNDKVTLFSRAKNWQFKLANSFSAESQEEDSSNLAAPMPGTVIEVKAKEGDIVKKNDAVIVIEAMKMEHTIRAHKPLKVTQIFYQAGDLVEEGVELIAFEEIE